MSNGKQPKVQKDVRDFRRFIEVSFPVKDISEASNQDNDARRGHIKNLHTWWARRPLAASRATAYAALTPAPKDAEEWQKKRDFIIQLSQWENSNNQSLLERARREILEANGGVPPKVLDPFSGGGSYPLEALRLGCESYANDYNPVAVLIEKATLEYPQKFGRPFENMPEWAKPQARSQKTESKKKRRGKDEQPALFDSGTGLETADFNPLLNAVRHWGEWVMEEVSKELAEIYLPEPNGNIPFGYIWARTIPCQNPSCNQEIPLINQFWISKKDKKNVALFPDVSKNGLKIKIVGDNHSKWPKDFDPTDGTVSGAVVKCLFCGSIIDAKTTRQLFKQHKSGQKMLAVVLTTPDNRGKTYRAADKGDEDNYTKSIAALNEKSTSFYPSGFTAIPDESIPFTELRRIALPIYGMEHWRDIFNDRQKLALITFIQKIREVYKIATESGASEEFAQAVTVFLALAFDKLVMFSSSNCTWKVDSTQVINAFAGRHSLAMTWNYFEMNPISGFSASWSNQLEVVLDSLNIISRSTSYAFVSNTSATSLNFPDEYFDAVLTDPPYYDNVPYSHLSDFFYVWIKRILGDILPQLFTTPLTPKSQECVQDRAHSLSPETKTKEFFQGKLTDALLEARRVLKPNGICVIVYAHKSIDGWETLINSLLNSGLVVTSAWPIGTEMNARLNANENASLASSIYIIARKSDRQPTGFYNDVRQELRQYLDTKLHRLWEEGIGGGDFFIAAIGSAIEVFGKYEQVMDFEGNIVRADRLLEEVRVIATNYAVKQILHDDFATEVSPIARFYVLWRWNYGEALVPFDEANKLAHSCGLDLSLQFGKNGFIKKEKEFARLLGPQGRKLDDLDDPRDMIDVLHKSLLLWEKGQRAEMVKALSDRGFGKSEAFYRVAQAISETLPLESKEKKLLDGFLAGRDRVQQEVEKEASQERLL